MTVRFKETLKPDISSFGYATFLSISTTSIWGGVYPYLPDPCQTPRTTILFYLVQMIFFLLTFCSGLTLTWKNTQWARKIHIAVFSIPLGAGPLMLIAAMYTEVAPLPLIIGAATLVGIGSAGYLMSWQRVFAAMDSIAGTLALIKGTAASALLYFCLCFIPAALTSYLIPLVLVPLAGLCLWLAAKQTDSAQPMFEDVPAEHRVVYRNALKESIPVALSIGAFGFCSGAIRFIAVTHQALLGMINIASMAFLLFVTIALFAIWRTRPFRLDLLSVFRLMFPIVGTCLMVLPFMGKGFTNAGFAVTYSCFQLACMLMMMHCGQISRDSGINPVFVYAFYAAIAYLLQTFGYVVGYISGSGDVLGVEQLSMVAIVCLYVMLLIALCGRRIKKLHTSRVEFLAFPINAAAESAPASSNRKHSSDSAEEQVASDDKRGIEDITALKCEKARQIYALSDREKEVMELIVKGNTGPAIAEMLFISENTVRTHSKRIYAKMGVHKKQELLNMVDNISL